MLKNLILFILVAAVTAGIGYANQSSPPINIKAPYSAPADGHGMYVSYCASCHGVDGKGGGPTAGALNVRPADLTVLAKDHRGKFPSAHLASVLKFGTNTQAHGSAQMPVWGPVLGTMSQNDLNEKALRIHNLSLYIESLQVK